MKSLKLRSIGLGLGLISLLIVATYPSSSIAVGPSGNEITIATQSWQNKVDASVLSKASTGKTQFLIYMEKQADLSGAEALTTKAEKGEYVFRQLTAAANETQPAVRQALQSFRRDLHGPARRGAPAGRRRGAVDPRRGRGRDCRPSRRPAGRARRTPARDSRDGARDPQLGHRTEAADRRVPEARMTVVYAVCNFRRQPSWSKPPWADGWPVAWRTCCRGRILRAEIRLRRVISEKLRGPGPAAGRSRPRSWHEIRDTHITCCHE